MTLPVRHSAGGWLRAAVGVPLRPQTYRNLLYLAVAFPLGLAYLIFLSIGVSLGVGLLIVVVGLPILGVVIAATLGIADFERRLTSALLGVEIDTRSEIDGDTGYTRVRSILTTRGTWTAMVFLASKFVFGTVALVVVLMTLTTGVSLLLVPLYYDLPGLYVGFVTDRPIEIHPALYFGWNQLLVGFETALTIGSWEITTLRQATVVSAIGVAICLLGLHLLNALAWLSGRYSKVMLAGTYDVRSVVGRSLSA